MDKPLNKNEVITQLESLKAESEYMSKHNRDDNEIWKKDIIALNRAIRAIEKRRLNVKKLIQLFVLLQSLLLSSLFTSNLTCCIRAK